MPPQVLPWSSLNLTAFAPFLAAAFFHGLPDDLPGLWLAAARPRSAAVKPWCAMASFAWAMIATTSLSRAILARDCSATIHAFKAARVDPIHPDAMFESAKLGGRSQGIIGAPRASAHKSGLHGLSSRQFLVSSGNAPARLAEVDFDRLCRSRGKSRVPAFLALRGRWASQVLELVNRQPVRVDCRSLAFMQFENSGRLLGPDEPGEGAPR